MFITEYASNVGLHLRINTHLNSYYQFSACLQGVKVFTDAEVEEDLPLVAYGHSPEDAIERYAKNIAGRKIRFPWSEHSLSVVPKELRGLPKTWFEKWMYQRRRKKLRKEALVAEENQRKMKEKRQVEKEYYGV